jgi:hypothetical protein
VSESAPAGTIITYINATDADSALPVRAASLTYTLLSITPAGAARLVRRGQRHGRGEGGAGAVLTGQWSGVNRRAVLSISVSDPYEPNVEGPVQLTVTVKPAVTYTPSCPPPFAAYGTKHPLLPARVDQADAGLISHADVSATTLPSAPAWATA